MPASARAASVLYTAIEYTLTASGDGHGSVTLNPAGGTYASGTTVTLTPEPASGYSFSGWVGANSGDIINTSGVYTIVMNGNKSVTASFVAQSVVSTAAPSDATPTVGQQIVVSINIDMSGVAAPDNKLGSFTGSLDWDPAILTYSSNSGLLGGFTGAVNTVNVATGHIAFNGANATGATGNVVVFQITFNAVGAGTSTLNLEYTAMATAYTFTGLLPVLTVTDGQVVVSPAALGGVNDDGLVDSTDALIILSADVGMDTWQFCPMNCGDANGDGLVDSTDALIILSYDVGMAVPFPVGQAGCPASVTQPAGCTP
jgi:hypothetical protein